MAHVEPVDGLHQAADGFLQQVGVGEAVVAEPLGDVGGEADVGAGEAVLEVDVAVAQAADGDDSRSASSVQCSRMNWAIGQGSSGGLGWPAGRGKWRISTRTSSLLQSQKLVRSSRSSSGVSRSDEKVA